MRVKSTPVSSLKQQTPHCSASRTRTKHKRLDAICEETYNINHAESNRQVAGDEDVAAPGSELRRSSRARRAPVLLDASPPPRKKRRKLGKNGRLSVEKNVGAFSPRVKEEESENGEDEETPGTWRSRLRSRRRIGFGRYRERNSPRRKLFAEMDGVEKECRRMEGVVTEGKVEMVDKIEEPEFERPLKVKSKRNNTAGASSTRDIVLVSEKMDGNEIGGEVSDWGEVEHPLKVKLKRKQMFSTPSSSRTRDKVLVSEKMDSTRDNETGDKGNDCGEFERPLKVKLKRKRMFNTAGASRTRDKLSVSEKMDGIHDNETGGEGNDCGEVERLPKVKLKRKRMSNMAGASTTRDEVLVSEKMDGSCDNDTGEEVNKVLVSEKMDVSRDNETGEEGNDCGEVMPLEGELLGIREDEKTDNNAVGLVLEKQEELSNSNQAAVDCAVNDSVTITEDVEQGECMGETVAVDLNEVVADLSLSDVGGGPQDGEDVNLVELDEKLMEGGGNLKEDKNTSQSSGERPMYSRIKEGRRCGLCGGGTDGKPPKRSTHEIGESENEASNGSSASDEANYDIWDGFANEPGWLGRLLGPINDRYGIAGTWVHQQCAVWSPECFQVYFAGLGCLKNVRAALCRGRALKCSRCGRPGATIGCRVDRCPKTYHL